MCQGADKCVLINFSVRKPKIVWHAVLTGMSAGIASLHKILKDETRRKIILQLHEKGSLSYVDLMKALGIVNTGKMNYHLKVLGDLLLKREDGQYVLTEKGRLASRLLLEFPEKKSQAQIDIEWPLGLWIAAGLSSVVYITVVLVLYFLGYMDFAGMVLNVLTSVSAIVLLIVSKKMQKRRTKYSPKRQMLGAKISIMAFGAWIGAVICFFGGSLVLIGLATLLRSTGIRSVLFPFEWWVIISFVLGPIIGGYVGYLVYKRSKYSKIAYYDPFA